MTRTPATKTRRCSAGERCASYAALGQPAKLSRGNPGPLCYACGERHAASLLRKAAAPPGGSRGQGGRGAETPAPAAGEPARVGGNVSCAKGSCPRPASERLRGVVLCRAHADADRAGRWREERARWARSCDGKLREALDSGDEEQARKWEGLLEEARVRLAWAEADLAEAEAKAEAKARTARGG